MKKIAVKLSEKKLCPLCGKRTMRRKQLPRGKYALVCPDCGTERGPFKKDEKQDVA